MTPYKHLTCQIIILKYSRNDQRKAMFHSPITLNVDKVELPIIKRRTELTKKKIDKLILPLYPVQIRGVLFSR